MTIASPSRIRFSCDCGKRYFCRAENAGKHLHCRECDQELVVPDPSLKDSVAEFQPDNSGRFEDSEPRPLAAFSSLMFAVMLLAVSFSYQRTLDGPAFMTFYTFVFAACLLVAVIAATPLRDKKPLMLPGIISGLAFLLLAVIRLIDGYEHGMHRFGGLIVMSLAGTTLILIAAILLSKESPRNPILPSAAWKIWPVVGLLFLAGGFFLRSLSLVLGKELGTMIKNPEIAAKYCVFLGLMVCFVFLSGAGHYIWSERDRRSYGGEDQHTYGGGGGCGGGGCGGGGCGGGGCGGCSG